MTAWSEEEDTELKELVQKHRAKGGKVNWGAVLAAATRTLVVRGKNSLALRVQRLDPAKRAANAERRAPKRAAQRAAEAKRRAPKRAAEAERRAPKRAAQRAAEAERRAPKRAAEPYFKEFPAAEVRQQIVASEPAGSSKLDLSVVTVTIFSREQLEGTMELSAAEREFHETFNAAFDASAKETDARDFHQHKNCDRRTGGNVLLR